jgi:cell division protease FtsH
VLQSIRRSHDPEDHEPTPWRVEGDDATPGRGSGRVLRSWHAPGGKRFWIVVILLLVANWWIAKEAWKPPGRLSVPYTLFRSEVSKGNVREITSRADEIQGDFRVSVSYQGGSSVRFRTRRPAFANDRLLDLLVAKRVVVNARPPESGHSLGFVLLTSFAPTLLLVGLFIFILRRGSLSGMSGLGRSKARLYDASVHRTDFDDVAGIDEAKEELAEIVDYLRSRERYVRLGATIPRGVLLSGPPGTGKTLLARAVAGQADVPFYSLSASEFVEMVAGVGASRVRDLFAQAKKSAPAIVFIDELDAIGRARGGSRGFGGGQDEREQTLNQILTEMDGFSGSEGVIVLAATNRPEILDTALLRPGRFDRRVVVAPPDQEGRQKILAVHTRRVPLAEDVSLAQIAANTPGMVGADLRNLVNEAALLAARRDQDEVSALDFAQAFEKVILGAERKITISRAERERTAYHESGHALLGMLQPGADPVRKVSIVPRGQALGVTFQSPDIDRYGYDADYLRGRIIGLLGGRAAEELVYGTVTSGAENDLAQVTRLARLMVGRWGMSRAVGLMSVLPSDEDGASLYLGIQPGASEGTHELVDLEVRRLIAQCYDSALERLRLNRHRLDALAAALLEHETLDEQAAYQAAGFPGVATEERPSVANPPPSETADESVRIRPET